MQQISGIGAGSAEATAINNVGVVVGARTNSQSELSAFVWNSLTRRSTALPGLAGSDAEPEDISDTTTVVGTGRAGNGQFAALLWTLH